ncbi:EAL domain-containing protein [Aurantiacibacter sp. MUD11]|uniref:EAL domain-containing protein n=1 Tax=Aurantiacibacter sp. MUD11 TaxID=3003265 RepID=UPI0022AAC59A|nr:EAL domain-containing protein [Aurantiacibacter sp. MUD11]WAT16789.1 EAL domain-containing protein [Aurantiacibacter sp. MUD11]
MVEQTSTNRHRAKWLERVRHVAWAGLIALALHIVTIFQPVDQFGWLVQSRVTSEQASGDIVYIGSDADLTDPAYPQRRRQLAEIVDRLDEAGVDRVFVDLQFDRAANASSDRQLNSSLRDFSGEAYLVRPLVTGLDGERNLSNSTASVSEGVSAVASDTWMNFLGYTWELSYEVSYAGQNYRNFASVLAGGVEAESDKFPVHYGFSRSSIPTYRFLDLQRRDIDLRVLAGKTVVIGDAAKDGIGGRNIPGHIGVPPSLISIYGAETLKAGHTQYLSGLLVLIATFAALLLAATVTRKSLRYGLYMVVTFGIPVGLLVSANLSVRMSIADALVLLLVYSLYRARASMKSKLRMVDPDTNLPTFAALEADQDIAENVPAIIVAKIHRFEEVRRTLPADLHADYVLAIAGRLKAATQDATIYLGQGHLIAWTTPEKNPALLRDHLEGLRALFSSPLTVGNEQVDVGITFGIDISASPNVVRRLASAVAVAEKTTETFEPISIADTASEEDLIWNISLQARIDAALANGEIYLAYQPKIMVQTGEIIGAEALVRWNDPVKGQIPPDYFIRQCETAGRMSQLTRFVLEEACKAGNAFADAGLTLPIAVNISATLLHERNIVQMVSEVLEETGFEPRRLTLEITETYRISNLDLAAEILCELRELGPKISMDDFGVGAASLEALLRLPFSELKIDRMFIAPMTKDPKALGIVKSVLKLGKDLRIIVVAEGVEDAGTLTLLRESGCLVAQGFAISRPVKFDKIIEFHRSSKSEALKNIV